MPALIRWKRGARYILGGIVKTRNILCSAALGMLAAAALAAAPAKQVTLTFGSSQSALPTSGIVQQIAKDYEAKSGIKIDFQISPDAQWLDISRTKLATGEAPDIFAIDADPLNNEIQYRPSINCVDLSGQEFVSRMDKSVIPSVSVNGKIYAITFGGYKVWWYYYNKKIFSDLGLKPPRNYAEFKTVCQKIKDAGIVPIYESLQDGWHQQLPVFELDGLYNKKNPGLNDKLNANKAKLKDVPELKAVLSQMLEFQKLGFYGTDYMSNSSAGSYKAFADGKAAIVLDGFGWEQQEADSFPQTKDNVGVFMMPWADNTVLGVNPASNGYMIYKKSKHVKEALDFFRYLASHDALQKRLDGDPAAIALCWPEIKPKYPKSYVDYLDTLDKGMVMQVAVKYIGAQWFDVGKDIGALYSGAMTVDQLIDSMDKRRADQAKLMKDQAWK
jgi:raffinose/stachyose/melibiose transport system substrate-binding protein